jgi:hypothetical protein
MQCTNKHGGIFAHASEIGASRSPDFFLGRRPHGNQQGQKSGLLVLRLV